MSTERPITFSADDATLIGVLHLPEATPQLGLILVVGGPQYRVGSHRLYLLLARSLAAKGIAVLRFDCRGMGDSSGEFPGFQNIGPDVRAAIDAFGRFVPSLTRYALWGLCDATLAICECAEREPRIRGVALVNPWARTESTLASTHLRHYYLQRVASRDFVRKILSGKFDPFSSVRSLASDIYRWALSRRRRGSSPVAGKDEETSNPLAARMAMSLNRFSGSVLLFLSGRDLTAKEFEDAARTDPTWQTLYGTARMTVRRIDEADHSFSERPYANRLVRETVEWLSSLEPALISTQRSTSADLIS